MADVEINNPWSEVDFDSHLRIKLGVHYHTRQGDVSTEPAEIIDWLCTDDRDIPQEFDALSMGPEDSGRGTYSPWTELDTMDDAPDAADWTESRDPEEVDAIDIPYYEPQSLFGGHGNLLFTNDDSLSSLSDLVGHEDKPIAYPAHPYRYRDSRSEWTEYIDYYSDTPESTLPGFPIYDKVFVRDDDFQDPPRDDRRLLPDLTDNLLEHFLPDRKIWLYTEDDPNSSSFGVDDGSIRGEGMPGMDMRHIEVWLDPDDFDPSDQSKSQDAIKDALVNGRCYPVQTIYDYPDSKPTYPTINSVEVEGETITVDAEDYESIEWISGTDENLEGRVIETGESVTVDSSHEPYVRARLTTGNPDGETTTQPFAISTVTRLRDATIRNATF